MSLVTRTAAGETITRKAAFRCKACGHLHHAEHAGERQHPLRCVVCKAGVVPGTNVEQLKRDRPDLFAGWTEADYRWISDGGRVGKLPFDMVFVADHANWQVLADCTPEELAEHGIHPHHVEKHVPFKTCRKDGQEVREPVVIHAAMHDGPGTKDSM